MVFLSSGLFCFYFWPAFVDQQCLFLSFDILNENIFTQNSQPFPLISDSYMWFSLETKTNIWSDFQCNKRWRISAEYVFYH